MRSQAVFLPAEAKQEAEERACAVSVPVREVFETAWRAERGKRGMSLDEGEPVVF
jgi:hypothetical protein